MRGSLYYLESRPTDPETDGPVTDRWLLGKGWKVLWEGGLGLLLHGHPEATPIEGSFAFVDPGATSWRWVRVDLEDNLRDAWPELPQRVKNKLRSLGTLDEVLEKIKDLCLHAVYETTDGEGNTVRRRVRVNDVPDGAAVIRTNLAPHFWAGDE